MYGQFRCFSGFALKCYPQNYLGQGKQHSELLGMKRVTECTGLFFFLVMLLLNFCPIWASYTCVLALCACILLYVSPILPRKSVSVYVFLFYVLITFESPWYNRVLETNYLSLLFTWYHFLLFPHRFWRCACHCVLSAQAQSQVSVLVYLSKEKVCMLK